MSNMNSWGGLVPIWIIGAPLLMALIEMMKTPMPAQRSYTGSGTAAAGTSTTAYAARS